MWHQPLGETFLAYIGNVIKKAVEVVSQCAVRPTKKKKKKKGFISVASPTLKCQRMRKTILVPKQELKAKKG
jgi:hypothetical protein